MIFFIPFFASTEAFKAGSRSIFGGAMPTALEVYMDHRLVAVIENDLWPAMLEQYAKEVN